MPIYKYKGANAMGEVISGTFTAKSAEEVVDMMRSNRQLPIEVKQVGDNISAKKLELNRKVTVKDLSVFCNQFNTLLKSGVTIIQCVEIFRVQSESKLMREAFTQVYKDIQTGMMLSEALRPHKRVFPDFLINMIESGEMSGNLELVTGRLSSHYEKENTITNKVKTAMVYPILLSVLAVVVMIGLVVFVLPTFTAMFDDAGADLPGLTKAVMAMSDFLIYRWYIAAAVVAAFAIAIPAALRTPGGKLFKDRISLKIPIVKNLVLKISTSRFARTLSTLLYSGVPMLQSLELTSRIVGNKVFENMLLKAADDVKKGSDLSSPLELSKLFPPILCNMVRIGESSGRLDETLERTANLYDSEVDDAVNRLTAVMEPIMIVVMAAVIGTVVISIVLPMFGMYEQLDFSGGGM